MSQFFWLCQLLVWLVFSNPWPSAMAQVEQGIILEESHQPQTGLIEQSQNPPAASPEPEAVASEPMGAETIPSPPGSESIPPEQIYSAGRWAEPRLWEMLNQGQYQRLDAEIKRLRQEDPHWNPPEELIYWLNHHLKLLAQPQPSAVQTTAPKAKRLSSPADRQRLAYEQAATAADRLHRRGQSAQALGQLEPWVKRIQQTRDAGRLELLAWVRLAVGQNEQALADFQQVLAWQPGIEAVRGELIALQHLERAEELLALAPKRAQRWPALKPTALSALRSLATQRHDSGDYQAAQRLLETAVQLDPHDLDTRRFLAWNNLKAGQTRLAADRFQMLYRETGDEESARGLILSLRALSAESELAAQAQADSGQLGRLWRQEQSRTAYSAGQLAKAWQLDPESFPELAGLTSPSLLGGGRMRWRSGDSGTSRLRELSLPFLAYEHRAGPLSLGMRITRIELDAGKSKAGEPLGSDPGDATPYRLAPTTRLSDGLRPSLSLSYTDRLEWGLLLDTTPSSGERSPRLDGALSLSQFRPDGAWSVHLEQRPVRESILSYTGLRDPYSGKTWGQVSKRGISAQGWQSLTPRLSLTAAFQFHDYQGASVADNRGGSGRLGLSYGFKAPGFHYLNLGPFIDYRRFADNLSHFTLGHGGYYSPQYDLGLGLSLDFQTQAGRSWLLKGALYAAWRDQEQDPAPWFPLADDGRRYAGAAQSGLASGLALQGAWLLAPHWQLSASALFDHSPSFEQGAAWLILRYQFEPRRALFSEDLQTRSLTAD